MSRKFERPVSFAPIEAADHDFIVRFDHKGTTHFVPVQLKELVPEDLNPEASLDQLIKKLSTRPVQTDTVLAIRLNRRTREDLTPKRFAEIPFKEVWLFWAASPDAIQWRLFGDLKCDPELTEFSYPDLNRLEVAGRDQTIEDQHGDA
jgi:hypothetical protein